MLLTGLILSFVLYAVCAADAYCSYTRKADADI